MLEDYRFAPMTDVTKKRIEKVEEFIKENLKYWRSK